jgi:Xaa-Pro aminopeptidase
MFPFQKIQQYLNNHQIDAMFISKHDRFFSEYVKECDDFLKYVTGFTGSAGFCLITQHKVFLWVDSRYTLQAKQEILSNDIQILNYPLISFNSIVECENIKTLTFDANKTSIGQYEQWKKIFNDKLIPLIDSDLNMLWPNRPEDKAIPHIYPYPVTYAGLSYQDKITEIKKTLTQPFLVTQPDELCWLFNLRGEAVEYSPLIHGYALISPLLKPILFLTDLSHKEKLIAYFEGGVDILHLNQLPLKLDENQSIYADFSTTPAAFMLSNKVTINHLKSPIQGLKAIKNKIEQENMVKAHIKDAVAVMETLCWIDSQDNKSDLTELCVVDYLETRRTEQQNFKSLSFPTIAGAGSNGAIIHYRPSPQTNKNLTPENALLLLDSGGQYLEGTTDITRTIALSSTVSPTIKLRYTQVLKGAIALSNCIYPEGTSGKQLDVLARQYLWQDGENFAHGTGHGVGCFLNVHEGPQSVSPRSDYPLQAGMVVSNEPGYYREGAYGIRLENLELIERANAEGFLNFKTLTLVPYDERCIDFNLLEKSEKQWLVNYYEKIQCHVYPHLSKLCQSWFNEKHTALLNMC